MFVGPWLFLGLISLYLLVQILLPMYHTLEDLQEYKIRFDAIRLVDSHDTKGSRMRLDMIVGDQIFYLWYPEGYVWDPESGYRRYADKLEEDLLSGKVTCVTAKVVTHRTIRDRLAKRWRVVDLRSGDSIYYELSTEKADLREDYIACCCLFPLVFGAWLLGTLLVLLAYQVVTVYKK